MDTENCVVDDGSNGKIVKDVGAIAPDVEGAEFPEAFIVKSVHLGDLSAFMIPSNKSNHVWVSDFVGQEEQEGFHAVKASVDKISHEEIVHMRDITTMLK